MLDWVDFSCPITVLCVRMCVIYLADSCSLGLFLLSIFVLGGESKGLTCSMDRMVDSVYACNRAVANVTASVLCVRRFLLLPCRGLMAPLLLIRCGRMSLLRLVMKANPLSKESLQLSHGAMEETMWMLKDHGTTLHQGKVKPLS